MNIKPMNPPKNKIIEEFEKLIILDLPKEQKDLALYKFYNKYFAYFENIEDVSGNKLIGRWLEIKVVYVRILDERKEYKPAIYICRQLDKLIPKLGTDYPGYNELKQNVLFCQGITLSQLRKFRNSNKKFKQLIDTGKKEYMDWYIFNYAGLISKYLLPLSLIVLFISFWNKIVSVTGLDLPLFSLLLSRVILVLLMLMVLFLLFSKQIVAFFIKRSYKVYGK
ncbi:MAG: hypothetical protein ACK5KN_08860 [Dysgonomonas sp.]|uniref:hypothetical protein n=1 Tax=Dysgonomonas sp. TaxID=1891233 RepID=UPI003A84F987